MRLQTIQLARLMTPAPPGARRRRSLPASPHGPRQQAIPFDGTWWLPTARAPPGLPGSRSTCLLEDVQLDGLSLTRFWVAMWGNDTSAGFLERVRKTRGTESIQVNSTSILHRRSDALLREADFPSDARGLGTSRQIHASRGDRSLQHTPWRVDPVDAVTRVRYPPVQNPPLSMHVRPCIGGPSDPEKRPCSSAARSARLISSRRSRAGLARPRRAACSTSAARSTSRRRSSSSSARRALGPRGSRRARASPPLPFNLRLLAGSGVAIVVTAGTTMALFPVFELDSKNRTGHRGYSVRRLFHGAPAVGGEADGRQRDTQGGLLPGMAQVHLVRGSAPLPPPFRHRRSPSPLHMTLYRCCARGFCRCPRSHSHAAPHQSIIPRTGFRASSRAEPCGKPARPSRTGWRPRGRGSRQTTRPRRRTTCHRARSKAGAGRGREVEGRGAPGVVEGTTTTTR